MSADADPATSKPSKPSKARGTRLPDGWVPDDALIAWTKVNAPAAANVAELDRFRDYWQSLSGQRAVRADWAATWRNWARRCQEQHTQPNRGPAPRATTDDRVSGWLALADSLDPNHQDPTQPSLIAIEGGAVA